MDGDRVIALYEKGACIGDQFFVESAFATGTGCGVIDGRIFVFVKAEAVDFGAIDPDDSDFDMCLVGSGNFSFIC